MCFPAPTCTPREIMASADQIHCDESRIFLPMRPTIIWPVKRHLIQESESVIMANMIYPILARNYQSY